MVVACLERYEGGSIAPGCGFDSLTNGEWSAGFRLRNASQSVHQWEARAKVIES